MLELALLEMWRALEYYRNEQADKYKDLDGYLQIIAALAHLTGQHIQKKGELEDLKREFLYILELGASEIKKETKHG